VAIADKGYDSKANRAAARKKGIAPVIPRKANSKERGRFFPKELYKLRARVEQATAKLKRSERAALCCDKTVKSYSVFICFVCAMIWVKSVLRA